MSWMDDIEESDIFIVFGVKEFFDDARCFAQAIYAKDLDKPFLIFLQKGVKIPSDFLEGVKRYKIIEWADLDDLDLLYTKTHSNTVKNVISIL